MSTKIKNQPSIRAAEQHGSKSPSSPRRLLEIIVLQSEDLALHLERKGCPLLKRHATPSLLRMDIDQIGHEQVVGLLNDFRARARRDATGYRLVGEVNSIMKWAIQHGYRSRPFPLFPIPKHRAFSGLPLLSAEESHRVLETADRLFSGDLRIRILVRTMLCMGLTVTEATSFSWNNVDYPRREYVISDGRGRLRLIPIPQKVQVLLLGARQVGILMDASTSPSKMDLRRLAGAVRAIGEAIGISGLTPDRLTKTFTYQRELIC